MAETNEKKENTTVEKIESVGQIIIGEMEKLGGILTGDPVSQAEGELVEEAGGVHFETAEALEEAEEKDNQTQQK